MKHVKPTTPYLHVGCGTIAPTTWHNMDASWNAWLAQRPRLRKALAPALGGSATVPWPTNVHIHNVLNGLPFADGALQGIYASHFIEHITRREAILFLRECHRTLAPGGSVRLLTPDLRQLASAYAARAEKSDELAAEAFMAQLHMAPDMGEATGPVKMYRSWKNFDTHKHVYDAPGLARVFREAGFREASARSLFDTALPHIRDVEDPLRFESSFAMEARK